MRGRTELGNADNGVDLMPPVVQERRNTAEPGALGRWALGLGGPHGSRQNQMRRHGLRGRRRPKREQVEGTDRQLYMCQDWNRDSAILFGTEKVSGDLEDSNADGRGAGRGRTPSSVKLSLNALSFVIKMDPSLEERKGM